MRDGDFTLDSERPESTYFADANRETLNIARIETPDAVASTDAIALVPGIDTLFVGPADLGLRLAAAPPANGLTLADAIDRVSGAVQRHGKAWGIRAGSIEKLARRRGMDAQIVPR
ncbi:MAG TPA: aldolase/citrate lyase family protein, partial [Roseiflexaceae bacterium]|nr:aldolase/citrate lyase family protein [Roseiflexaceae bacterium]